MARRSAFILLASVLALSACGSDPRRVDGATLRLRLDEYRITPQDVEMEAGRIRVVVRNAGRLTHNVAIESETETDSEDNALVLGRTPTARPGGNATVTVDLEPGTYRLHCTVGNHDDLGQYGRLVVR